MKMPSTLQPREAPNLGRPRAMRWASSILTRASSPHLRGFLSPPSSTKWVWPLAISYSGWKVGFSLGKEISFAGHTPTSATSALSQQLTFAHCEFLNSGGNAGVNDDCVEAGGHPHHAREGLPAKIKAAVTSACPWRPAAPPPGSAPRTSAGPPFRSRGSPRTRGPAPARAWPASPPGSGCL